MLKSPYNYNYKKYNIIITVYVLKIISYNLDLFLLNIFYSIYYIKQNVMKYNKIE